MFSKMRKNKSYRSIRWLWLALSVLAILVSFTQAGAIPDTYAQGTTVTVDFATQLGAPTYRTSGWIYGLSEDGTQPPQNFQSDIKAQFFRAGGAQLGCPNGGWANGGYSGYVRRWNSVAAYYQRAKAVGATFVLLPHDLWGADLVCDVPVWPGDNGDWTNFNNFIDQIISDVQANGMTGADVHWDIWNEPDCCGFWNPNRPQSQYLEMWKRAYQRIRTALPNAVIVGPSTAGQPSPSWGWFNTYLDYVGQNNVVPDYISWHELNTGSDPVNTKNNVVSMLSSRGISVQGYQVNEYGAPSEQTAGDSAWYMARLERAGIDGLRANWGMYGGLYDTMGELVVNSGGYKPLGAWWVYKRYADMTGTRIGVTGAASIDGVAATDSATQKAIIVLGSRNTSGTVTVNIRSIPAYLVSNNQIRVLVERMPETNGAPVTAPTVVQNQDFAVSNNQVNVPISWSNSADAYVLTLTPGSGSTPTPTPTPGGSQQYEAENGTWGGGASVATDHSGYTGTGFVAYITNQGAYNSFTVNVSSAGNYPMTLRYSAGPNGPTTDRSMSIYVNGTDVVQTVLPRTSTWDVWATKTETLSLNAGSNTIRYQYDSSDTGWINLDHIVVGGGGPTPTPTLTPTPTATPDGSFPVPGTYYRLIARHSGKVADVSGASTADGGNVIQWPTNGGANQQWRFESAGNGYYNVINRNSGKCLDVEGISTADGTNIYQWTCLGGANQHWQLLDVGSGYYELRAEHSGKCLDVEGISTANGANVHQWTCLGGANQQWSITP